MTSGPQAPGLTADEDPEHGEVELQLASTGDVHARGVGLQQPAAGAGAGAAAQQSALVHGAVLAQVTTTWHRLLQRGSGQIAALSNVLLGQQVSHGGHEGAHMEPRRAPLLDSPSLAP